MNKFDQMWFISHHSLPCGPHTSSIGFIIYSSWIPGWPWYRSSHPDPRKSPQLQIMTSCIIGAILLPSCVFFHIGEQKISRWCQIRRIWRVINQFKATVMHSSYFNHRLVCRSIILANKGISVDLSLYIILWSILLIYLFIYLFIIIIIIFFGGGGGRAFSKFLQHQPCKMGSVNLGGDVVHFFFNYDFVFSSPPTLKIGNTGREEVGKGLVHYKK